MKLTTSTEALKKAMVSVQALISEHQVILKADKGSNILTIEAGSDGAYLRQKIPASVTEAGEVVINSTYISSLQLAEKVELSTVNDSSMSFTSGTMSGVLQTHQAVQKIADQRPLNDIPIQIELSKDIVTKSIAKSNFNSALTQTQEGLRVKIDANIAVSITDSYRCSLYKEKLPFHKTTIDFQIKPTMLSLAVSKVEEQEVWFGLGKGLIKIASPSFEFYHPTMQSEPTDVEAWLESIDHNTRLGEITTNVQDLIKTLSAVTSITGGPGADVKLICAIKGNVLHVEVAAAHGSAKADLQLIESSCDDYKVVLHSKYTTEMLSLIKDGVVNIGLYEDIIILSSGDGKCTNVVPTVSI
jgi:hypothetical protein